MSPDLAPVVVEVGPKWALNAAKSGHTGDGN